MDDVTADATFTISPDGLCTGASSRAAAPDPHVVTATVGSFSATTMVELPKRPMSVKKRPTMRAVCCT